MNKGISALSIRQVAICDFLILVAIYFLPTLSHLTSFPLYQFDPMRIAVLGSLLFLGNKKNAYVLAITLPLFSFIVAGHPIIVKNIVIAIELTVNVALIQYLGQRANSTFFIVFLSIVISKALYYLLKSVAIVSGLLCSSLIDTNFVIQLIIAVLISISFTTFSMKIQK